MKTTLTHRHGVPRKKKDDEGRMKKEEREEVEEEDEESRTLTRRVIARISKCVYKLGHRRFADTGTGQRRGGLTGKREQRGKRGRDSPDDKGIGCQISAAD